MAKLMHLRILLPYGIFAEIDAVTRLVAETEASSLGLLPRRRDCVAALAPGILIYETEVAGEVYVAVDEGVLIKTGANVSVSVRQAFSGTDLGDLRDAVDREFMRPDEDEQSMRSVLTRLESEFLHRLARAAS